MTAPVLLIHDDAQAVAGLKRLLALDGREVVLALTVAEALAALQAALPSLVLLAPGVEAGRGHVVLEELVSQPRGRATPVLLLGESSPGFTYPVAAMPPGEELLAQLQTLAPKASVALLAGAERSLQQARAEAAARRDADERTTLQLQQAHEVARTEGETLGKLKTERDELTDRLQSLEREHEQTQTALASLSREHDQAVTRRDALQEQLDQSLERARRRSPAELELEAKLAQQQVLTGEQLAQTVREARAAALARRIEMAAVLEQLQEQLASTRGELGGARAELSASTTHFQKHLAAAQVELDEARRETERELQAAREEHRATLAARETPLREQLAQARAEIHASGATHQRELGAVVEAHESDRAATILQMESERAAGAAALGALREAVQTANSERDVANARAQSDQSGFSEQLAEARQQLEAERSEGPRLRAALAQTQAALEAERSEGPRLRAELAEAQAALEAERSEGPRLRAALVQAQAALEAERSEGPRLRAELVQAQAALEAERSEGPRLRAALAQTQAALEAERTRAEGAEAATQGAQQRIHALENSTHLVTAVDDGAPVLAIARTGTVALGELARLAVQLTVARADVRVDLKGAAGTRRLWLRRGTLVAAWSSIRAEALPARARRDGLIDERQEAELAEERDASPGSLLDQMRQRGLLRKGEVQGLVQRHAEEVALEALTEAVCTYRLYDEAPGPEVPLAESARVLPVLVAQALRRALPWESQLELLGGSEAVPRVEGAAVDAEGLGFNQRERALLESIDGQTTIETLIVSSGLRTERGYQALAVAKLLGLIAVDPAAAGRQGPGDDAQLLEAKYEQVQQTDYFAILGVARTADAAEVLRARERLARQFDPLRYSQHSDPSMLHRAQVVFATIEEAANTLQDDHLRAEYARHLPK